MDNLLVKIFNGYFKMLEIGGNPDADQQITLIEFFPNCLSLHILLLLISIQSTPGFGELSVLRDFVSKIGVHLNRGTHRYVNNH